MKKKVYISVSTDPVSDSQGIIDYATKIKESADFLHCDIMDENFVSKQTYDYSLLKRINAVTLLPLDVHLMIKEPLLSLDKYIDAGANVITVHYEAFEDKQDIVKVFEILSKEGVLKGISLKVETPFKEIKPYSFNADVILIMSVEPGESGQKYLSQINKKILEVASFRKENNLNFKISVDGGVNLENAKMLKEMGVDIIVSGSCVFNAKDQLSQIQALKNI